MINYRSAKLFITLLVLAIAGLYIGQYFFTIYRVEIIADPPSLLPSDRSLVTVRFLSRAGLRVPFGHRKVEFEIIQGGEHCTLEDAQMPEAIYIHALSPGDVILHIRVDGFAIPFEKTVHIGEALG